MPESKPPPEFAGLSLDEIVALNAGGQLPPVDKWHPAREGDSRMRIAADGIWYHEGAPIRRPAMVRLFSSILRREPDGSYALVTPAEKLSIEVEDAPFVAVELKSEGVGRRRRLAFRLNTEAIVVADADHPLRVVERDNGPCPYITVRKGLEALIARPVYYELAELAIEEQAEGLWSEGQFFALDTR